MWDKEPIPRSQALPPYSRPKEALSSVKGCNSGSLDKEPECTSEHVFLVLSDVFKNKTQTAKLVSTNADCLQKDEAASLRLSDFCLSFSTSFSRKASVLGFC